MGTGSHGQSIETTMTQIVADEMGVNIEDVHFIQGDTALHPVRSRHRRQPDGRAWPAGRRTRPARRCASGCSAVAGQMLEIDPGDLEMTDSVARVKGDPDSKSVTLAEIAAAAYLLNPGALPPGAELGLEMSKRYKSPDLHVLQRLPRGDDRDRPGDRHGGHPAVRDLRGLRAR